MIDDPIGDALAIALEAIEEHAGKGVYADPKLAAAIELVKAAMEDLQLLIQRTAN